MSTMDLASLLPWPKTDVNKYTRGKALVVAGSAAYPGAACLAAFATERVGAGYTEVHCAPEAVDVLRGFRPTLVVRSWDESIADEAFRARSDERHPLAAVVGSGMEADDAEQRRLVLRVLAAVEAPVLVDGGALAALATEEGRAIMRERAEGGFPAVMTPHGGEAARLAKPVGASEATDAALACALADAYRATVVLKGPDTLIARPGSAPEGALAMTQGTSALAKAGTGDVLAGMIGGLLAQGIPPFEAAVLGATLHAEAGRIAAADLSAISVTALDAIDRIPAAIRSLA